MLGEGKGHSAFMNEMESNSRCRNNTVAVVVLEHFAYSFSTVCSRI